MILTRRFIALFVVLKKSRGKLTKACAVYEFLSAETVYNVVDIHIVGYHNADLRCVGIYRKNIVYTSHYRNTDKHCGNYNKYNHTDSKRNIRLFAFFLLFGAVFGTARRGRSCDCIFHRILLFSD